MAAKTVRALLGALLLFLCGAGAAPRRAAAQAEGVAVSFEVFESGLAPYGEWVVAGSYGRVFRPAGVAPDWRPYTQGEWVWTVEGWFWASDEPWAWAAYHYGRWIFDPWLGWIWLPGYDWAPAWVAWRVGGGYIGWAPIPPGVVAWWVEPVPIAVTDWVFVPAPRFVGHPVHAELVPPARVPELVPRTRPAPPRSAGVAPAPPRGGPPRPLVEAEIGRPVRPAPIVAVPSPDAARGRSGDAVPAFRPGAKPAPAPAKARAPSTAPERRPAPAPAPATGATAPAPPPSGKAETAPGAAPGSAPAPAPAPAPKGGEARPARPPEANSGATAPAPAPAGRP